MDIICEHCKSKFTIADEKLPEGKISSMRCPKCKGRIEVGQPVTTRRSSAATLARKPHGLDTDFEAGTDDYDVSEKPFDFLEEEGKTAILCEEDPVALEQIKTVLDIMEYHITVAEDVRDALRKMKYHLYDLVMINESFAGSDSATNGVLIYLERLNMDIRRNIFVALISRRFSTMDSMAALLNSVNITINVKDMSELDRILSRGVREWGLFYAVFKESQKKMGLA